MFFRIITSDKLIRNIYRLYSKNTTKNQKYFLNFRIEHNNKRYFVNCHSLFNKQQVKENSGKNNNDKEDYDLQQSNKPETNQNSKESNIELRNTFEQKQENKKDDREKLFHKDSMQLFFENSENKDKGTYLECLRMYESIPAPRKDVVSFITVAMRYMEEFGVHKDLQTYKKLLDLFPKGKMIATNIFQTITPYYPREQYCATSLLDQMELNSVIPDIEMETILLNIFGRYGLPTEKYWKMMYWMPKFKNLNPWPVPNVLPDDVLELAKLAMIKISSVDVQSQITVFDTADVEDAIEKTWIVSAMAPKQSELLMKHDKKQPIFVEGPFRIYVSVKSLDYFFLNAKPDKNRKYPEYDPDAVDKIRNPYLERTGDVILPPSVHEEVDATIFAVCATGTSSQDSLLSWIRCLQKDNPVLGEIPIVFTLKIIPQDQLYIESSENAQLTSGESNKNDDNELLQG